MDKRTRDSLERKLREQRNEILKEVADAEAGLEFLAEDRESELEERAQEDRMAKLLAGLDLRGRRAVEEIDLALQRVSAGGYGTCLRCGERIPVARLRALPATRYCVDCAKAAEREPMPRNEAEIERSAPVPPDTSLLSDREREEQLRERVREDGRVDLEELRIVCRHGVAHLDGFLPSEGERQILTQIVTDVGGFRDVDDRIQIKKVLWEREERTQASAPKGSELEVEPATTEDVVESMEEGTEYDAPTVPTPEEE